MSISPEMKAPKLPETDWRNKLFQRFFHREYQEAEGYLLQIIGILGSHTTPLLPDPNGIRWYPRETDTIGGYWKLGFDESNPDPIFFVACGKPGPNRICYHVNLAVGAIVPGRIKPLEPTPVLDADNLGKEEPEISREAGRQFKMFLAAAQKQYSRKA